MTQENHLKAILKKYVLRTDLKTLKDSACLISEGREFQSFGAQDEKARSGDRRRVGGIPWWGASLLISFNFSIPQNITE